MKKYLVISDIHGSLYATKIFVEALNIHHVDGVLLLGDILYHGPRNPLPKDYNPKEVSLLLNEYKQDIIAIRGNCDSEVDQMLLAFPILSDYSFFQIGKHRAFLSHGHLYKPEIQSFLKAGDLFLSGHTHIPTPNKKEGIYFLNPGSISLPKQGHLPSYAILTENFFQTYTTDHQPYIIACALH